MAEPINIQEPAYGEKQRQEQVEQMLAPEGAVNPPIEESVLEQPEREAPKEQSPEPQEEPPAGYQLPPDLAEKFSPYPRNLLRIPMTREMILRAAFPERQWQQAQQRYTAAMLFEALASSPMSDALTRFIARRMTEEA